MLGNTAGLPRVLVYHAREPVARRYVEELVALGYPAAQLAYACSEAEAIERLDTAEVLLAWRFPPPLMAFAPRLRWVQSMGAGVDDLAQNPALPRDCLVTRVVGQFGDPIAEYVFAYLLYLYKGLDRAISQQADREWAPWRPDELGGRTIGLAGVGSIGQAIAVRAKAFNMRVCGLSRTKSLSAQVDEHFAPDEWAAFVARCDAVVLALPLTPQTTRVVDAGVLAAMRDDAVLVNVGRGQLLDEDALVQTLCAGRLRAAVLDVFDEEPLPALHPLWTAPRAYITPHIAGPSQISQVCAFFADNLVRDGKGLPLLGVVDRERGY